MSVSQKCQYALRALFELALRRGAGPVKIAEIAEAQEIPVRFLEVILSELKGGGFVQSRRGAAGGYQLARPPRRITVGELIRFVDGPVGPVECLDREGPGGCAFEGDCAFLGLWRRAHDALSEVYDETTIEDLVEESRRRKHVPSYSI
jgi:Rrf2 family protein